MGEGFHLLHVPLVGDGQQELRLFQGQNHGGAGGGGLRLAGASEGPLSSC